MLRKNVILFLVMVNTRRTKFLKKKEERPRVSQPQEEKCVGTEPNKDAPSTREVSMVSVCIKTTDCLLNKTAEFSVKRLNLLSRNE